MAHRTPTTRRKHSKAIKSNRENQILDLTTRLRKLRAEAVGALREAEGVKTPHTVVLVDLGAEAVDQAFTDAIARLAHARE